MSNMKVVYMRFKLKGFITAILIFSATYLSAQNAANANGCLSRGESLFKENNAKDAVQVLEYEIMNGQVSDNSYNFLGLGYYQLGEYEKEFLSIYMKFTNVGGDHMEKIEKSIHKLLFEKKNNPFSTYVNDIKQAFQAHLHNWEAENYYVQKNRDGYGISLPPELIDCP